MDIKNIKGFFPIFKNIPDLVYFDNAATSHKPYVVINRIKEFYEKENANIHRGIYKLSEKATLLYEDVRKKTADFIGAEREDEIIFTKGATESINLIASCLEFSKNDEVIVTEMEHHSNLIPWQKAVKCKKNLKFIPVLEDGTLDLNALPKLVNKNTKLVAVTYISNVLGTINPVAQISSIVKNINNKTLILVDAAQAVPHIPISVLELGVDFLAFSAHKMMGPTGVGVLWGKNELLELLDPYQYGGSMISRVSKTQSFFADVPYKFEAGTQNIAGVVGFGASLDFLKEIGMRNICKVEEKLTEYLLNGLSLIKGVKIYGQSKFVYGRCNSRHCALCVGDDVKTCKNRLGIVSFNIEGVHPHDTAQILDKYNIAVRAGHHCAMPLHKKFGEKASVRASLYVYNNKKDIDKFLTGIERVKRVFKK